MFDRIVEFSKLTKLQSGRVPFQGICAAGNHNDVPWHISAPTIDSVKRRRATARKAARSICVLVKLKSKHWALFWNCNIFAPYSERYSSCRGSYSGIGNHHTDTFEIPRLCASRLLRQFTPALAAGVIVLAPIEMVRSGKVGLNQISLALGAVFHSGNGLCATIKCVGATLAAKSARLAPRIKRFAAKPTMKDRPPSHTNSFRHACIVADVQCRKQAVNEPNQMMRISERLGFYDRSKLNMKAPVR